MLQLLAKIWLLKGLKYKLSAFLTGPDWDLPIQEACAAHGLNLDECPPSLEAVANFFRGHWFWLPDPAFQLYDVVYPPFKLLARGGDDCDGAAMIHAQAAEYVLGPKGYKAYTISYFAKPWWMSHHYALIQDPAGKYWIMQPQPAKDGNKDQQVVYGPYTTVEETVTAVAGCYWTKAAWWNGYQSYQVTAVFYDMRNSKYERLD